MTKILTILFLTVSMAVSGQGIFEGFQILKIPRENIPLGAEWVNGIGVNGIGVPETNITINRSINSFEIDKIFKQSVDLSILSYFNLDGSYLANTTINYTNLTIYTVKDFSATNLNSGQLIIYECIKADSIYFKVNKAIDASLKLKLDEKVKDLKLQTNTNFNNGVTFSGNKLFLAFRVFELGKTKVTSKSTKIKDTKDGGGLREVKLMNYQITFNDYNLQKCVFPNTPLQYNETRWTNCEKTTPIDVVIYNFNRTNISGQPLVENTSMLNSTYKSLYFSQRQNNKLTTDFIEMTFMIKDPKPLFFFYMDPKSKVVIKRMETTMKMFKNPSAPGW
jgi:hypothetical protein